MKLLVFTTHPIQYQAPWFRALAVSGEVELTVAFGLIPTETQQSVGFGVPFTWDLPLLDGYRWLRLQLGNQRPELDRFGGVRARGLRELLASERPDAVLVTGWNSYLLLQAVLVARQAGIPTMVRGDSSDLQPRAPWKRWLHRWLFCQYSAFLVVGAANREFYLRAGVAKERLFDVPHFVDNVRFADAAEAERRKRAELRRQWGIPPEAVCALFAGKFVARKRPGDLLAAMASIRRRDSTAHLLMVGDGELRDLLKAAAVEGRLPVSWTGFMNQGEIASAYAVADFVALPSDEETWGLVVNEAMACGLPALVSDRVGCGPDLVLDGQTGFVHRCADIAGIAACWQDFESNADRRRRMGENARKRLFAGYSVERAVEGTLAALRFVLREARA